MLYLCGQGRDLSDAELQGIMETYDLDHNGVCDEVIHLILILFYSLRCNQSHHFKIVC